MKYRLVRPSLVAVLSLSLVLSLGAAIAVRPAAAQAAPDRDGDGIPDEIEDKSWYRKKGGDPDRQDIWLECDFMQRIAPSKKERNEITANLVKVFDLAPVTNPSGETGIALHLTFQGQIPWEMRWGNVMGGLEGYTATYDKMLERRAKSFSGKPFGGKQARTMKPYMYYCAVINSMDAGGVSGVAMDSTGLFGGIPGDMFIVALGLWPGYGSVAQHTGTLMHELGHSINLTHGGGRPNAHSNHKPNYLSVMSYFYQEGFLRQNEVSFERFGYWDFSTFKAKTLDERRMNENKGVAVPRALRQLGIAGMRRCGTAGNPAARAFLYNAKVDWNCDGTIGGTGKVDVNKDGAIERLGGAVDWDHLILGSTAALAARSGTRAVRSTWVDPGQELDLQTSLQLEREIRRSRVAPEPEQR